MNSEHYENLDEENYQPFPVTHLIVKQVVEPFKKRKTEIVYIDDGVYHRKDFSLYDPCILEHRGEHYIQEKIVKNKNNRDHVIGIIRKKLDAKQRLNLANSHLKKDLIENYHKKTITCQGEITLFMKKDPTKNSTE